MNSAPTQGCSPSRRGMREGLPVHYGRSSGSRQLTGRSAVLDLPARRCPKRRRAVTTGVRRGAPAARAGEHKRRAPVVSVARAREPRGRARGRHDPRKSALTVIDMTFPYA